MTEVPLAVRRAIAAFLYESARLQQKARRARLPWWKRLARAPELDGETLALAARLLLASRRFVSPRAAAALYDRPTGRERLAAALGLLEAAGCASRRPGGLILVTAQAQAWLAEIGAPLEAPEPFDGPRVPEALRPAFEAYGVILPPPPPAPPRPAAMVELPPAPSPAPEPPLAAPEPTPEALPEAPEPGSGALPWELGEVEPPPAEEPAPVAGLPARRGAGRSRRRLLVAGALALTLAAGAALAWLSLGGPDFGLADPLARQATVTRWPREAGRLLARDGGGLYWSASGPRVFRSTPGYADYRRAIDWSTFDRPDGCALGRASVREISLSADDRYARISLTGPDQVWIADFETRTVQPDLPPPAPGARLVGWREGPALEAFAPDGTPYVRGLSEQGWRRLTAPPLAGGSRLRLDADATGAWLLDVWGSNLGTWRYRVAWSRTGGPYDVVRSGSFRFADPEGVALRLRRAAQAPDRRFALLAFEGATGGRLAVLEWAGPRLGRLALEGAPLDPGAPLGVVGALPRGRYAFFYNARTPEGPVGVTGVLGAGR